MFLRTLLSAVMICGMLPLYAGVYTLQGHNRSSYGQDIVLLRDLLEDDPGNLENRAKLIRFYYVTEQFRPAVIQCERYIRESSNRLIRNTDMERQVAYIRIISLASSSRYTAAVRAVDSYIETYKPDENSAEQLRQQQQLYRRAEETRSAPEAGRLIADNVVPLGTVPESDDIIVYDREKQTIESRKPDGSAGSRLQLPEIHDAGEVLNIAVNRQKTLCLISRRTAKGAAIEISYRRNGRWSALQTDTVFRDGLVNSYPSFLPDGHTLLFCSNREDDRGIDIYSAVYSDDSWQDVEPLQGVNTRRDEASVFVHPSGEVLVFSSNGRAGLGGFDLYMATIEEESGSLTVSDVDNIGEVNTYRNEVIPAYVTHMSQHMFAAHRNADRISVWRMRLNRARTGSEREEEPIQEGTFTAHNIQFDTGSARLRPGSYPSLIQLYQYLMDNPDAHVKISGHTDNTGSESYNRRLSLQRAHAVRDFLHERGISGERITTEGHGAAKPLEDNSLSTGRQKNRRVEITITVR